MEDTFDSVRGYYRGFGWYRKHFTVNPEHKGRTLIIRFGAIANQAQIWVNGVAYGTFTGGYTPIEIDITDVVQWDQENLVAVRVNNIHNDEIPPGRWRMDFNNYGGMYREVELLSLSPVHLVENEFFVTTPIVDKKESKISVQIQVQNELKEPAKVDVKCQLYDNNKIIATFDNSIRVPMGLSISCDQLETSIKNVTLWTPENPKLYTLKVSLIKDGKAVDDLVTFIGFRSFGFDAQEGFSLNGKLYKLRGLNRHQCYPGLANALPPRLQIRDAEILKELGANFVRCSHYPQHPDFLDACDKLGIMVYEEIPSWQHVGGDEFIKHTNNTLEDMIRRDRNHPSIIMWGLMNEGRSVKMFNRLQKTAHRLDPTRPTSYAENNFDEGIRTGTVFIPDVLGLNYKLSKYDELHEMYPQLKLANTECTNPDNSIYGDYDSELKGVLKIKKDLDFLESRNYLGSICIWGMHDYGSAYKPVWPIQTSGMIDVYRRFKESAYYLQSRWAEKPVIHIAGHWTWPGEEGKVKDVYVWSNCDVVSLSLNGKKLEPDEKNNLLWHIPYESGELLAVGKKGKIKVQSLVRTAASPAKILLSTPEKKLKADGYDAIAVEARIVDAMGTVVPVNLQKVTFSANGPARIIGIGGSQSAEAAKGYGTILVQSTGGEGKIVVTARSAGLKYDQVEIHAKN